MRLQSLVFLLFLLIIASLAARSVPGGWSPIDNINDPYITGIANYAVTEYDKRSGAKLKFEKVIKGESQVVVGTNYRLILSAANGSASNNYEALVWERVWLNFKNLTSFEPVHA
ncbi:cysteine proteinase inhibitor [Trifolium repens]|jgi:cystatin-C|nr:cysteine proteinase inhibitor [Trifolium repens]